MKRLSLAPAALLLLSPLCAPTPSLTQDHGAANEWRQVDADSGHTRHVLGSVEPPSPSPGLET